MTTSQTGHRSLRGAVAAEFICVLAAPVALGRFKRSPGGAGAESHKTTDPYAQEEFEPRR